MSIGFVSVLNASKLVFLRINVSQYIDIFLQHIQNVHVSKSEATTKNTNILNDLS